MDIWQFKIMLRTHHLLLIRMDIHGYTCGPHEYKKEWILQFEGVQLEFKQMTLKL